MTDAKTAAERWAALDTTTREVAIADIRVRIQEMARVSPEFYAESPSMRIWADERIDALHAVIALLEEVAKS